MRRTRSQGSVPLKEKISGCIKRSVREVVFFPSQHFSSLLPQKSSNKQNVSACFLIGSCRFFSFTFPKRINKGHVINIYTEPLCFLSVSSSCGFGVGLPVQSKYIFVGLNKLNVPIVGHIKVSLIVRLAAADFLLDSDLQSSDSSQAAHNSGWGDVFFSWAEEAQYPVPPGLPPQPECSWNWSHGSSETLIYEVSVPPTLSGAAPVEAGPNGLLLFSVHGSHFSGTWSVCLALSLLARSLLWNAITA